MARGDTDLRFVRDRWGRGMCRRPAPLSPIVLATAFGVSGTGRAESTRGAGSRGRRPPPDGLAPGEESPCPLLREGRTPLDGLQSTGRRVGIISHVSALKERIGVRVHVSPIGNGRSRVRVIAG